MHFLGLVFILGGVCEGGMAEIAEVGRNIFDNGNLFLILFLGLRWGFLEKDYER